MRNFINLSDIDKRELRKIIDHAKSQKQKRSTIKTDFPLAGKTLIMVFEKPSTRTRLSFESAMQKTGWTCFNFKSKRKSLRKQGRKYPRYRKNFVSIWEHCNDENR